MKTSEERSLKSKGTVNEKGVEEEKYLFQETV